MKIVHSDILRSAHVLPSRSSAVEPRYGLLLRHVDDAGRVAQGEASPLPGYSPDELEPCRRALQSVPWASLRVDSTQPVARQLAEVGQLVPASCAAARCAVETAWLDLLGQRRNQPAWALLSEASGTARAVPSLLPLAKLLSGPGDVVMARHALAAGVRTLKVKLGAAPFADELAQLGRLRRELGGGFALRLDANQAWHPGEARERLRALIPLAPELVEEPCADLTELATSPVPLALDESLQRQGWLERLAPLRQSLKLTAVVLKPMALGGPVRCIELGAQARKLGLACAVSHLFDGPVALSLATALGLAIASPELAQGVAAHAGLEGWPRPEWSPISQAYVVRRDTPGLGLEPLELAAA